MSNSFDKILDVSAVLRACCASVHSFLVWGDPLYVRMLCPWVHQHRENWCYVLEGLHVFMPWYVHGVLCSGALLPRCVCGLRAPRQDSLHPQRGIYRQGYVYPPHASAATVKGGATRCVFTLISQCDTVTLWGP
ncbi:hypothetical protein PAPYR_11088 [Paratrimastix pyriformis]|uniref:Uncharacterized protein n=1 Tax=Paratrimastix pyriformis TaxID=342808 RepID=A0ABQ8U772_9EUKA|nr:hypothetical protein PAPYR_11088 [Paratrimastix pyriformis]